MITISLCMIVKNEEEVLARCLDSAAAVADEIVIVDTGSTDKTREIAERYTDKVYSFAWRDDLAAARNVAFSHAERDFILWLDADDVLREEDADRWLALKASLALTTDIVMAPYHTAFDGEGKPSFTYYRERLIRNGKGYRWQGRIHEVIAPVGTILYTEAAVCHRKLKPGDPDRNLRIFETALAQGETLDARQQYYYARELYYHGRYAAAEKVLTGFLSRGDGWVENQIGACQLLAYCDYALGREEISAGIFSTGAGIRRRYSGMSRHWGAAWTPVPAPLCSRTATVISPVCSSASATTGWENRKRRRLTTKWLHPINRRIPPFCTIAPISPREVSLNNFTRTLRHRT